MEMSEKQIFEGIAEGTKRYLKSTELSIDMESFISVGIEKGVEKWLYNHKEEIISAIAASIANRSKMA